jgi:hypothetical protein
MVKFTIDGENVSGNGYIIDANSFVDIRRHWDKDVGFKFVSLDSGEAVDFGKNGPNEDKVKGLIEAKFYLEKENKWVYTQTVEHHHHHHHYPRLRPEPYPWYDPYRPRWTCDASGGRQPMMKRMATAGGSSAGQHTNKSAGFEGTGGYTEISNNVTREAKSSLCSNDAGMASLAAFGGAESARGCAESFSSAPPTLKDGCTVEGDATGQGFRTEAFDAETDYVSLKIFLQGYDKPKEPVAVPAAPKKVSAKSKQITDLEAENEKLRQQLAEIENEKLKKKLARAKKKPTKKTAE